MKYETYTLILKHSVFDGEEEYELEEPLVIKHMADLSHGSSTYIINEMLSRMEHELISRCAR